MKFSLVSRVRSLALRGQVCAVVLVSLLAASCPDIFGQVAHAQEVKAKAEAEGKLMFYATFNAADSKALTDAFKQLYPKIDATFYRATDAALMERILTEGRAGQNLWDVAVMTSFYGHNLKKRGMFALYDSPERKYFRAGYKDDQGAWT